MTQKTPCDRLTPTPAGRRGGFPGGPVPSRFRPGAGKAPAARRAFLLLAAALPALLGFFFGSAPAQGLAAGKPFPVKILVDLSKSMYPGYRDAEPVRERRFVNAIPEFRDWFAGLARSLEGLNASSVEVLGFATDEGRRPADRAIQLQPPVKPAEFNKDQTFSKWIHSGLQTDLDRNLRALTGGFEGVVFLLTDNRVESGTASEEQATEAFFRSIKEEERFRAVHLYRYDLKDPVSGRTLSLAAYGLVVSAAPLDDAAAMAFESAFRSTGLLACFHGVHVKLRPLDVKPVTLDVRFLATSQGGSRFVENEPMKLMFQGRITNNTLYALNGGTLSISLEGGFQPRDRRQARDFGLETLPAALFRVSQPAKIPPVPPGETVRLSRPIVLDTAGIPLSVKGLWKWLAKAAFGLEVPFVGTGVIRARDLEFQLTREGFEKLAGIYGAESLQRVFRVNETKTVRLARPDRFPIAFRLKGDPRLGLVVVLLVLAVAVPAGVGLCLLARKAPVMVCLGERQQFYNLRRMSSMPVRFGDHELGSVGRGLFSGFSFRAGAFSPRFRLQPTPDPNVYTVLVEGQPPLRLEVRAVSRGAAPVSGGGRRPPAPSSPGASYTGM